MSNEKYSLLKQKLKSEYEYGLNALQDAMTGAADPDYINSQLTSLAIMKMKLNILSDISVGNRNQQLLFD